LRAMNEVVNLEMNLSIIDFLFEKINFSP
jgi:hypothetical protein